jgi:hypothetical protein
VPFQYRDHSRTCRYTYHSLLLGVGLVRQQRL